MRHNQHGQTLVEMIVVVTIVVLLATGIVAVTTVSLARSQTSKIRSEAVTHAQAGLELARGLRDTSWADFVVKGSAAGSTYCVGTFTPPPCSVNINGTFTRFVRLQFTQVAGVDTMIVTSSVSWGAGTPNNTVHLVTYLTQWK